MSELVATVVESDIEAVADMTVVTGVHSDGMHLVSVICVCVAEMLRELSRRLSGHSMKLFSCPSLIGAPVL